MTNDRLGQFRSNILPTLDSGWRPNPTSIVFRPSVVISDLELGTKRFVVEKHPRILVLSIPLVFQLPHALHQPGEFRIADKADQSRTRFRRRVRQ